VSDNFHDNTSSTALGGCFDLRDRVAVRIDNFGANFLRLCQTLRHGVNRITVLIMGKSAGNGADPVQLALCASRWLGHGYSSSTPNMQ
jgi:hypothetical protein